MEQKSLCVPLAPLLGPGLGGRDAWEVQRPLREAGPRPTSKAPPAPAQRAWPRLSGAAGGSEPAVLFLLEQGARGPDLVRGHQGSDRGVDRSQGLPSSSGPHADLVAESRVCFSFAAALQAPENQTCFPPHCSGSIYRAAHPGPSAWAAALVSHRSPHLQPHPLAPS